MDCRRTREKGAPRGGERRRREETPTMSEDEELAAVRIQSVVRGRRERKNVRNLLAMDEKGARGKGRNGARDSWLAGLDASQGMSFVRRKRAPFRD
jgi:hypothetical protein